MPKTDISQSPIGVFDSGLGGLTVVKQLMRQAPHEHIVYFGDTARVPYGTKSKDSIIRFSIENTEVLLKHNVKAVVVACNSSSSYALKTLKSQFSVPVIGVVEPGAQKAAQVTKNKRIGVIATTATIKSKSYQKALQRIIPGADVFTSACPLFVPLVEEGWLTRKITQDVAREYLNPLRVNKIDTLILGCTHYPLLKNILKKVVGSKVELVDSAYEVAIELKDLLKWLGLQNTSQKEGKSVFIVSDKPQEFSRIAKNFLGRDIKAKIIKQVEGNYV